MDKYKDNTPEMFNNKKEPPFRVPDNYFGDFSARLHSRLETETAVYPEKKKGVIRYLKPALGLAASFALIFVLVYWPLKSFLPEFLAVNNTVVEQVDEMEMYMPSIEGIDEDSFFSMIVGTFSGTEQSEDDFNDEELLNYISANVSDYELYFHTVN